MTEYDYIRDGMAIYEKSFAIIRAEADLSRFSDAEADVAVRMIHAAGSVDAARHFEFSAGFVDAGLFGASPSATAAVNTAAIQAVLDVGGLVTLRRHRGASVAEPSVREAREVFEARALLAEGHRVRVLDSLIEQVHGGRGRPGSGPAAQAARLPA